VRAPSAGVVAVLPARKGSRLSRGETLVRLVASSSGRRYGAEAAAAELRDVRVGDPCRLRTSWGETIPARIQAISPREGGRRIALEIVAARLPQRRGVMSNRATVEVTVAAPTPVVTVPEQAVRREPSGAAVWVIQPDTEASDAWTAHRRPVRLGPARDGEVEVRDGLAQDSRVIVAGMETLQDGQAVSAVKWNLP
jgi:RND family efflux transporter MFP subunit